MYSLLHCQDLRPDGFLAEADFDHIAHLHIIGCTLWTIIYEYSASVTGFVRHRAPLDESRYFQIFV